MSVPISLQLANTIVDVTSQFVNFSFLALMPLSIYAPVIDAQCAPLGAGNFTVRTTNNAVYSAR
jgi:hypothetical protein